MENELVRLDRNRTVRRFRRGSGCVEVKNKKHGEAYVCLMCGPMVDKEHRKQSVAVWDWV